ncbi:hypothetical protein Patl1_15716 [Pistacia atlantica]|uniref:Uncharacterized protein n=1 Tax=Pistacia atlantica TaxID=434234 RepID=A0ACC1BBC9_9ROSI|nr:hypothetical protein Patl1_15716 [Pistacia atlantica]
MSMIVQCQDNSYIEKLKETLADFQEKLKERERELRKRKEREEQEMERVRLKVRRKEAVTSFQALLVETIKDPQVLCDF